MHYYQHHIGDFIKDTANLTNEQLAVYLKMLWRYYLDEKPLAESCEDIAFAVRSDEKTVHLLLRHFFVEQEDGWHQARCDKEIQHFHSKAEKAKESANARWKNAKGMRTHTERNASDSKSDANQEPITNNQQPVINTRSATPPFVLPDWINPEHWDAWHSCQKRKKATNEQKQLAVDKLNTWRLSGFDHGGALENAAVGGYQGLFLPEQSTSRKPSSLNKQEALEARNRAVGRAWAAKTQTNGAIDA